MTIDSMQQLLEGLKAVVSSDITISDYLKLFDIFDDIEILRDSIGALQLSIDIGEAQQTAGSLSFVVEDPQNDDLELNGQVSLTPYALSLLSDLLGAPFRDARGRFARKHR